MNGWWGFECLSKMMHVGSKKYSVGFRPCSWAEWNVTTLKILIFVSSYTGYIFDILTHPPYAPSLHMCILLSSYTVLKNMKSCAPGLFYPTLKGSLLGEFKMKSLEWNKRNIFTVLVYILLITGWMVRLGCISTCWTASVCVWVLPLSSQAAADLLIATETWVALICGPVIEPEVPKPQHNKAKH